MIKEKCFQHLSNVWDADLVDMQLISKFNKGFRFLLCVMDIFSKYAWVRPLKDKKGVSIVNAFRNIFKKSNRKPNKIWIEKGVNFITILLKNGCKTMIVSCIQHIMKENLQKTKLKTLKNKTYKYITSISKNVYIDKLDDIVNEYSNTYHRTIKMELSDVKDNAYINIGEEVND